MLYSVAYTQIERLWRYGISATMRRIPDRNEPYCWEIIASEPYNPTVILRSVNQVDRWIQGETIYCQ